MRFLRAAALDTASVLAFTVVGRASHGSLTDLSGLGTTFWPFAAALSAGWLVTLAWRAPAAPLRTGLGVWAVTVAGAMLLRTLSGEGTEPAFIVVTSLFLGATLLGWRGIATWLRRRNATTP
ncbi:DUF3054 domain-containing protein [Nocardiopsis ansamitocini]|uniref:Membrane protein n=1 Tax=Nocardiopsis ansamitocini TaxID=1670832 RepID=A0A9W6P488_9ACTN|nr:DUF3054 domain-containing protein [Nocardiopsis ansamitocini]GLU46809.1 membrane protein [Nocardiopsis ansamitocini]